MKRFVHKLRTESINKFVALIVWGFLLVGGILVAVHGSNERDQLRQSLVESCERGNELRVQLNDPPVDCDNVVKPK